MRAPRIYSPQALHAEQTLELEDQAARHLLQVLRLREGDSLRLFNGDGHEYPARIVSADKRHCQILLEGKTDCSERESPLAITLAIAMSKGDRMDWLVQKATELGISRIQPLLSERVELRLKGERMAKKIDHWRAVAISACEQSGRCVLPQIDAPSSLADWLQADNNTVKLLLDFEADFKPEADNAIDACSLLCGPEGGFSAEEIAAAKAAGYMSWRMGPRVLRTETAPLAAISLLQQFWGDFQVG